MKKYAAIDIGTNSMRLLLVEMEGQKILHRQKFINTTRIGKSVDSAGRITPEGLEINLIAFDKFVNQAQEWGATEIWAIATSAVRDAENGQEFVDKAYEKTNITINIIDGKEEAKLGYKGVLLGLTEPTSSVFLIDIGGGSTELILGNQESIIEGNSYNVGALRMTERFITTDPPSPKELEKLLEGIKQQLEEALINYPRNLEAIIGIGGTATTIAALHQKLDPYDMNKVHGYTMDLTEIIKLQNNLKELTLEERKQLKGLHPKRADIIVAGMMIMTAVMELLNITYLTVSEYDNLEGLLYTKLNNIN